MGQVHVIVTYFTTGMNIRNNSVDYGRNLGLSSFITPVWQHKNKHTIKQVKYKLNRTFYVTYSDTIMLISNKHTHTHTIKNQKHIPT